MNGNKIIERGFKRVRNSKEHLIRDNAKLIVIFKQDELNLKQVYQDHISPDITFDQFKSICNKVWNKDCSFVTVNKECKLNEGRFRKGYDHFININLL
jgi:hypothetical protein